jgi:hypothetical protein
MQGRNNDFGLDICAVLCRLRGELIEISCAYGKELRDNIFNLCGLAIWHGIGQMDRNDPIEAESTAAVSQPEYSSLQRLKNKALSGPPTSCDEVPGYGIRSAYIVVKQIATKFV